MISRVQELEQLGASAYANQDVIAEQLMASCNGHQMCLITEPDDDDPNKKDKQPEKERNVA
ncbi:hypothetical protein HMF8227_00921 [Saliniradius amylolyticus]|uniref:Uncharacterized protein n=1 Tax=Saliniradius amylolyticus TaxID=2183582 RepID=A0A2S2E1B4_9ALTE|nr:hypothetical protein [Saliniradius amylolyticus]AWL11416.1 hypothetical protein HMF8227_00921 [Saliniradius amylolyticus]